MGLSIEIMQGTARDFPFQVTNPDGSIPTDVFLSTDTLNANVWAGNNETPLLTPPRRGSAPPMPSFRSRCRIRTRPRWRSGSTIASLRHAGRQSVADDGTFAQRDVAYRSLRPPGRVSRPGRHTSASRTSARSLPGSTTCKCRTTMPGSTISLPTPETGSMS